MVATKFSFSRKYRKDFREGVILFLSSSISALRSLKKFLKIQPELRENPVKNQSNFVNSVILRFQIKYFFTLLGVVSNMGTEGKTPASQLKVFRNTNHPVSISHLNCPKISKISI